MQAQLRHLRHLRHLLLAALALVAGFTHVANGQTNDPSGKLDDARATRTNTAGERNNRIIIKFKNGGAAQSVSQAFSAQGEARIQSMGTRVRPHMADGSLDTPVSVSYLKTIHTNTHVAVTGTAMSPAALASVAATLAQDPDVEYAEVDQIMHAQMTPNDSYFAGSLWNMKAASSAVGGGNFVNAWNLVAAGNPVSGSGVVIAVLDSGYRPHADLAANVVGGYDFVSAALDRDNTPGWDSDPLDPGDWSAASGCSATSTWHGTHISGIAAAIGNNATGVIGGAYGAKILPVRVLGVCGGYMSDIAAAMYWVAGLPQVKVINLSLGGKVGDTCSSTYQDAVTAVVNAGSVVVVATGNDYSTTGIAPPANCTGVIAVTAHTSAGLRPSFANVGPGTTLSAPGNGIYSTLNTGTTTPVENQSGDTIKSYSGTSMATPHVVAVAAMLYQVLPTITPALVKSYLSSTARAFPAGSDCANNPDCGAGLLDAYAAVRKLQLILSSNSNTPPVLASIPDQSGTTAGAVQFTATASDADNDPVTFTISNLPAGASFNNGTGAFVWSSPTAGTYSITMTPTDGIQSGNSQTVRISVTQAPNSLGLNSGGGGGGAWGWIELLVLLVCACGGWLVGWRLHTSRRLPQ